MRRVRLDSLGTRRVRLDSSQEATPGLAPCTTRGSAPCAPPAARARLGGRPPSHGRTCELPRRVRTPFCPEEEPRGWRLGFKSTERGWGRQRPPTSQAEAGTHSGPHRHSGRAEARAHTPDSAWRPSHSPVGLRLPPTAPGRGWSESQAGTPSCHLDASLRAQRPQPSGIDNPSQPQRGSAPEPRS